MIGLLREPAVIRLLLRASTAVRLTFACGHRVERASRTTCCDARAVRRATEMTGLFLSAIASASFTERWITELGNGAGCCLSCALSWPESEPSGASVGLPTYGAD